MADIRALTDADRELIALAKDIVDRHGDDSVSTMGAAVRDTEGRMYAAINLYHFTGGPCAELVALGVSVAQGAGPLEAIVAVGDEGRSGRAVDADKCCSITTRAFAYSSLPMSVSRAS